jgi:hypothetical protein
LLTEEGGIRDGRGAESYYRKKAWASINHSVVSGFIDIKLRISGLEIYVAADFGSDPSFKSFVSSRPKFEYVKENIKL